MPNDMVQRTIQAWVERMRRDPDYRHEWALRLMAASIMLDQAEWAMMEAR